MAVRPLRFIGTMVLYIADLDPHEPQHVPLRLVNLEGHPRQKRGFHFLVNFFCGPIHF